MLGKAISSVNIPAGLRERLLNEYEDLPVKIIKTLKSTDGTQKYLFALADGNVIEGVLMSYKYGNTQCVSTQVGCRMGCKFCASTLGGLVRNLSSGEILSQVLAVNAANGGNLSKRAVTNLVLMGSGEPLDNYQSVITFLKCVSAEGGINISPPQYIPFNLRLSPQNLRFGGYGLARKLNHIPAPDHGRRQGENYARCQKIFHSRNFKGVRLLL